MRGYLKSTFYLVEYMGAQLMRIFDVGSQIFG